MTDKFYNLAWSLLEPIIFEEKDSFFFARLTRDEYLKMCREYEALKTAVLEFLGTTLKELEAETERKFRESYEE